MFSLFEHESVYTVYNINRWPQIHNCKVLRFALVIRWIELRTVCYLSIPSQPGYLMPFPCLWSDHRLGMLCSGHLARKLYVFWYHSFLIRNRISFQTSCKQPFGLGHQFWLCFNWFGSSPRCRLYNSIVNIANIQRKNCCTTHLKSFSVFSSFFFLLLPYFQLQNYSFPHYSAYRV